MNEEHSQEYKPVLHTEHKVIGRLRFYLNNVGSEQGRKQKLFTHRKVYRVNNAKSLLL